MPVPRAAIFAILNSIKPGLITIRLPKKPTVTAVQRLTPTFSFKKIGDKAVTNNGAINAKVKAFAKEITEIE